ncbi:MAG: hypothetical protein LBI74_04155 [Synergistaceae bacterium]|jgi:hypothetical protein|nr:hypothetical protein [Synergistaceae bacterium]
MKTKKPKFDRNLAFNNIVGAGAGESEGEPVKPTAPVLPSPQPQTTSAPPEKTTKRERKSNERELIPTTIYITKRQHKAMKLRAALSDDLIDKDQSAIVRAALDSYLSKTLEKLEA